MPIDMLAARWLDDDDEDLTLPDDHDLDSAVREAFERTEIELEIR